MTDHTAPPPGEAPPAQLTVRGWWTGMSERGRVGTAAVGAALVLGLTGAVVAMNTPAPDDTSTTSDYQDCVNAGVDSGEYGDGAMNSTLAGADCTMNNNVPNTR